MARDHELWLEEASEGTRWAWKFGGEGSARHECMAWLPEGIAGRKLAGFVDKHGGTVVDSTPGSMRVQLGRNGWRARRSGEVPLELEVRMHWETACVRSMTHVTLAARPVGSRVAAETARQQCIELVKEVRGCLMAEPLERRFADRSVAEFPVETWGLGDDGGSAVSKIKIDGVAHDLSASGIAVLLEREPGAARLCLKYRDRASEDVIWATARVVRGADDGGGRHVCAARFEHMARFSKWDGEAELCEPELDTLFSEPVAGETSEEGGAEPGEEIERRFDDAHPAWYEPEPVVVDTGDEAWSCGGARAGATRAALARCLREIHDGFDDLEQRLRQYNAGWDVLFQQVTRQTAGRDHDKGSAGPGFAIAPVMESGAAVELGICGAVPEAARERSHNGTVARALLSTSTAPLREAAGEALEDVLSGAARRRWWALFLLSLVLSTGLWAGLAWLAASVA